jgi:hypothetical protein
MDNSEARPLFRRQRVFESTKNSNGNGTKQSRVAGSPLRNSGALDHLGPFGQVARNSIVQGLLSEKRKLRPIPELLFFITPEP